MFFNPDFIKLLKKKEKKGGTFKTESAFTVEKMRNF